MLSTRSPHFLVVVPTHNHPKTLEFSVRSALHQTVSDLIVAVIGDGANDETREIVSRLQKEDQRVQYFDFPKSPSRGETYRDRVIREIQPEIVTYLCDDDLFLFDHCEVMAQALEGADFAHPQPVYVTPERAIRSWNRMDLELEICRDWHKFPPWRNAISLTGASHTLEAYLALPHGWRTTPEGRWTDHYMWEQFLHQEGLKFHTSRKSTTIKLPAIHFTNEEQGALIREYFERLSQPGFREEWDSQVLDAQLEENIQAFLERRILSAELTLERQKTKDLVRKLQAFETVKGSPRKAFHFALQVCRNWWRTPPVGRGKKGNRVTGGAQNDRSSARRNMESRGTLRPAKGSK